MKDFPTGIASIYERVQLIDPIAYARTRNYIDGDVTYLSPYLSRGVISTRTVLEATLERGYRPTEITKFIQELAWREYYQRVWQALGDGIEDDIRNPQEDVVDLEMPMAVIDAATGIDGVDREINRLYSTGYMHNHARMYSAAICCNIARSHWKTPARWMYYHLLDGDWASNVLSWQWVAGTFSNKRYVADQANVNRFTGTSQTGTFLDRDYGELLLGRVPEELSERDDPELRCVLPEASDLAIDRAKPTLVYTSYNLDPNWRREMDANRILLLELSHFERYPVSPVVLDHVIGLAANISGITVYVGELANLVAACGGGEIIYKEHPFTRHFTGTRDERDWMFAASGYYRSFSAYWKQCEKELADSRRPLLLGQV